MTDDDTLSVAVDLDAAAALSVLDDLESRSTSFGRALTSALKGATTGGKGLEEVLRGVGLRLTDIALSSGLKPLETMLGNAAGSLIGSLSSGFGSALSGGGVNAFAQGGVAGFLQQFAPRGHLQILV